jgi:hypothetical protein
MKSFSIVFLKSIACLLLIACIAPTIATAQNPNVGTSGAKFLMIPIGGRATSLGGAYVAMANDASSAFWNPAGLAKLQAHAVQFSYLRWFEAFDVNAGTVVFNAHDNGVFAASFIVMSMDKMEITTESSPEGNGRFFDAQDLVLGLSYARFLTDHFNMGMTAKYVYQRIWNEVADGIAFDIGTQYLLDFNNLTIGMSMRNFGGDLRFDGPDLNITYLKTKDYPSSRLAPGRLETEGYPMPLHFQVGIGIDLYQSDFVKVRLGLDATHPNDNDEQINIGSEIAIYDRLFLRGGYRYGYDDEDLTVGVGVSVPVDMRNLIFEYAYSNYTLLPDVHRVTVGIEF